MLNYKELGFKCGIEIHQQLETNKLFCKCPSLVNDTHKPDIKIKRYLRAVAGETGKKDIAAEHEEKKQRYHIYEACSSSSCLVELDEEPPHSPNEKAIETAIEIALLLNCKVVDEIIFMRKTVVDGSNVSGFQRTALVGRNGYLNTNKGKVLVPEIYLEEEAAKRISENSESVTWRLDRLGVPLVEIKTDASIQDSEHCKEVASLIGMILRSTEKVKRGLGTIRQDVNISIKNGARTEIKGFQDLKSIPKVIDYEVNRQLNEIKKGNKIREEVRKANPDFTTTFLRPMPGSSRLYPETDIPTVEITNELLKKIKLPELIAEKAIKIEKKYKIKPELAKELIEINFDKYVKEFPKIGPEFIAHSLIEIPKEIKSRFNLETKEEFVLEALKYLNDNKIQKDAVLDLIVELTKNKKIDLDKYKPVDKKELENKVKKIVEKNKGASFNALMGEVMKEFKGKINGKDASDLLKKFLK